MSFLSKLFRKPDANLQKNRNLPQTCLVDASGFLDSGNRGKATNTAPNPREVFNNLRNIAEFASREGIAMRVFLPGRPLREAPDGGAFKSVKVHYADSQANLNERILKTIPTLTKSQEVLVITADPELDKAALKAGAACMRAATFRKTLEEKQDGRPEREQRGSAPHHANVHQRKRRFAPSPAQSPRNPNANKGAPPQPKSDAPPAAEQGEIKPDDAVKNLIDTL